ncbi:carbohydrate ABC transporter permease [Nocardia colli]|uniref:Carbohydrate ABC transporter permease n=1 Tax=Nocardia colli TaxID=2545717 RepID=A0A5N0E5T0_9NOCA|nr:carbohydrate ABC transporter permease [Nocardia colli]KAA8884333.1 carbohydrate ABC transporter permease [Nocardia colli]
MNPRQIVGRIGFYTFVAVVTGFFVLPMLWLASAPFDANPGYAPRLPKKPTLQHFSALFENDLTMGSLWNSVLLSFFCMVLVVSSAALAAYALSRVRIPGRDALLYLLLLLSSVVTGTAAMVPIFLMIWKIGLLDQEFGVVLVLSGGLLPAAIFILKDFMDSVPRSYEESARVFGAGPLRILRDIVVPLARPGLATIAVWTVVNVWGSYLVPFLLLRDQDKQPAAVVVRTFYDEGGGAQLGPISAFSLLYSIPVVLMYLFVNRRYGFRLHGGIKS